MNKWKIWGVFPYFWFNTQIAIAMGGLKPSEIREVDLWVCWIGLFGDFCGARFWHLKGDMDCLVAFW